MPWTGEEFARRHNKKLSGNTATRAANMAMALINRGMPEGRAIATANAAAARGFGAVKRKIK